jgi:hypothetical protein
MTSARRLRNGLLRPWVVDYMAGVEELDRLKAQGLDVNLTPDQAHTLGVALAEQRGDGHEPAQDLTLSGEASKALDQVVADRARRHPAPAPAQDQVLDLAIDLGQRLSPANRQARGIEHGLDDGNGDGQGEHAGGAQPKNHDRNGKIEGSGT